MDQPVQAFRSGLVAYHPRSYQFMPAPIKLGKAQSSLLSWFSFHRRAPHLVSSFLAALKPGTKSEAVFRKGAQSRFFPTRELHCYQEVDPRSTFEICTASSLTRFFFNGVCHPRPRPSESFESVLRHSCVSFFFLMIMLRETLIAYFTATVGLRGTRVQFECADRSLDLARESILMNDSLSLCATRYVRRKPHGRVCQMFRWDNVSPVIEAMILLRGIRSASAFFSRGTEGRRQIA
ncbi:uncharacterized protein BT62DRAFT_197645 [Guyanagaster necrorhizus]|uniref:Uncharacterized protein n=1 Tax=Guyanagaster necrorhizus TaxID=856835 RepID=A0A9P7VQF4_9AGAR|nr:uncharacterized protein BT62DRAFT_197645 [Guyanagaster necrorhizus MCA 3950]KAG7444902.1 hypothetical protein BT62DRAFT_197645 [Guyanagaster necrorhizus MCA 3950]